MKGLWRLLFVALGMAGTLQCLAADIAFSSRSDFTEMSLELRRTGDLNPRSIGLQVTLSPDAQHRLAQVTRQQINQPLRLFINGLLVSTATIQSEIKGPALMISVPREIAGDLVPTLLESSAP